MAAAIDESPVWKPRTTAALTLPNSCHNHIGTSSMEPKTGLGRADRAVGNPQYDMGAPWRGQKPRNDCALSTFRPSPKLDPSHEAWSNRSMVRSSQSQSDPLLNRPSFIPVSPVHGGSILHPIRENHADDNKPAALVGAANRRRTPPPTSLLATREPPRSMKNGLPQAGVQRAANYCHRPSGSRPSRLNKLTSASRETWEVRCCRISVLLVIMQICLGVTVTALAFYMERLSSSIPTKECPYWAGIPLLVAGVLGIYFCATDFVAYAGSTRAFIIKALCFVLSTVCVFLCMVAAVFPGIHGHRIPTYSHCRYAKTNYTCVCVQSLGDFVREFQYAGIVDCVAVTTSVKDILILQCALNAVASGVCLWFVTLLWKKRYEQFHSGLRFYSYSASIPPHPWSDPSNPPYYHQQSQGSPVTIRKLSQHSSNRSDRPLTDSQNATLL